MVERVEFDEAVLAAALSVHELAALGGDGWVGVHEDDLSVVGQRIL
jgi:hypothetical protein